MYSPELKQNSIQSSMEPWRRDCPSCIHLDDLAVLPTLQMNFPGFAVEPGFLFDGIFSLKNPIVSYRLIGGLGPLVV